VQTTGVAAATLADVVQGLEIDTARMRRNIEATRGVVFAERAVMLLAPRLGRDEAQTIVSAAVARSRESGQAFADALRATPRVAAALPADVLADIDRPESYLGDAEVIRQQLLAGDGASE
jgi:3-carboxy-cis,cis-muconate cycloisomerase